MATSKPAAQVYYFAYGSNLSLTQMRQRCPTSKYHALGILRKYRWIINTRGYANVIPASHPTSQDASSTTGTATATSEAAAETAAETEDNVYGLLYTLRKEDERRLDLAEGVPDVYSKLDLEIEVVGAGEPGGLTALVYVDEKRVTGGICREEYVARMNRGIADALEKGMPSSYVRDVLRKWVRDDGSGGGDVKDPFFPGGD